MATDIKQGDKCWVQTRTGKKHYGICTGFDHAGSPWFAHNTSYFGVVHTDRKGFAGHRVIHIEQRAPVGYEAMVAARALSLVGREYNLLRFNCEHAANLAATGKAQSKQVQDGLALAGLGTMALAALVAALNENGTRVDGGGYRRDRSGHFAARRWW